MGLVTLFNVLPQLPETLQTAASQAVRKAAFMIQLQAAENAPVDLGALKASIYVVTKDKSGYDAAAAKAQSKNPKAELLPGVEPPPHALIAIVAVGVGYGAYQEFGTVNIPAHPYLTPAAEMVKPQLEIVLNALVEKAIAEAAARSAQNIAGLLGTLGSL